MILDPELPSLLSGIQPAAATAPARRSKYARTLDELAGVYQCNPRTLKHWIKIGREAEPRDLPPLDQPADVAAWWRKHRTKVPVPDRLLELAMARVPASAPAEVVSDVPTVKTENSSTGASPASFIDLAAMQTVEGAELVQACRLRDSTYQRLCEANAAGLADEIRRWTPLWKDYAAVAIRAEQNWRQAQEKRGMLIVKADVINDLAQLLESLRIMREAQPDAILARLARIPRGDVGRKLRRVLAVVSGPLRTALLAEREREDDILRSAAVLRAPGDVLNEAAA